MLNRLRFIRFLQVSQIFQRRKRDANKLDFENKLNLTCQAQSTPKTAGILTKVFSTSGPNLVALAWTGDDVIAQTSSKWDKFWLWSSIWPWRSRSIAPKTHRDLDQGLLHLWSKFGDPSLNGWWVIARTSKWLPHARTEGHTHRRRQRQYPKAKPGLG